MSISALLANADRLVLSLLGEPIRFTAGGVEPEANVVGIFTAAFALASVSDTGLISSTPAVFFRLDDIRAALGIADYDPENDDPVITRSGTRYTVREARKDGDGGVLLLLRETT